MALAKMCQGATDMGLKKQPQKGAQWWHVLVRIEEKREQRNWLDGAHSSAALVTQEARVS